MWVCHIKAQVGIDLLGQLDCKILANLLKLKVLKYIIMHSSWQLAKTRSLSFLLINQYETLQVDMSYQDTIEDGF